MGQVAIATVLQFEIEHCYSCAIPFALPLQFQKDRREDHGAFYCPNGHCQSYKAKSEAERLRQEMQQLQSEKARITQELWNARGERDRAWETNVKLTENAQRLTKRLKAGVCPCCKRTISQMARHMKTKHPDWKG